MNWQLKVDVKDQRLESQLHVATSPVHTDFKAFVTKQKVLMLTM